MKRLTLALVLVVLAGWPTAATAGGSVWYPDRGSYVPGEQARILAAVSWGHNSDLGTPDDGPFGVWLSPVGNPINEDIAPAPGAIYVGDILIDAVDASVGPHVASLDFTVPDLPPGDYAIQHCNTPCTTSLGDITFGQLTVRDPASPPPTFAPAPTSTMPPTTTTTPTTSTTTSPPATTVVAAPLVASSGSGGPPSWLPLVVGATVVLGAGVSLLWLLGERRPRQATVKPT
jgi:hypothetical protein